MRLRTKVALGIAALAVAALPLVASATATDNGCAGCCCPDGPCCEAR